MRLRILVEVAERDVLLVAREVREPERLVVDHAQETRRSAAMLDVRLTHGVRGS
jgi:hypothetical protein